MKNKLKEILTYEIYQNEDKFCLHVPVQNLINPKFLLKNNELYILLYDYTQGYIIKSIPLNIIEAILNKNCYLCEAINPKSTQHPIILFP